MKIGTLVECIDDQNIDSRIQNKPVRGKIYTIRAIIPNIMTGQKGLLLEEITNDLLPHPTGLGFFEPNFNIKRFAELPVPEMNEILQEIELLC